MVIGHDVRGKCYYGDRGTQPPRECAVFFMVISHVVHTTVVLSYHGGNAHMF